MKVHVETWIATALLQRENPERESFTKDEILERAYQLHPGVPCRPGVAIHISQHCLANARPNPARYRMLYRTRDGRYRLFRESDDYHPQRQKGPMTPKSADLPDDCKSLLDWYHREYLDPLMSGLPQDSKEDPLMKLKGLGKDLWKGLGGGDAVIRWLRSDARTTPPWEIADSKAKRDPSIADSFSQVWKRIRDHEGKPFRTKTGLTFTYQVAGQETLRPVTRGRPVSRLLPKRDFEKAWLRLPVSGPADLQDLQGPSYLFGILTDQRIGQ